MLSTSTGLIGFL